MPRRVHRQRLATWLLALLALAGPAGTARTAADHGPGDVQFRIVQSGTLGANAYVCAHACAGAHFPIEYVSVDAPEMLLEDVRVTAEWAPTSPLSGDLRLQIYYYPGNGWSPELAFERGPSPLVASAADLALPIEGEAHLWLQVGVDSFLHPSDAVQFWAHLDQPYTLAIEGSGAALPGSA